MREYFAICDSYFQAIRKATAQEIETIDMARRGMLAKHRLGPILVDLAGDRAVALDERGVAAQRAVAQLKRVQAKVAGTVLNGLQKQRDRYYNYYTYYRGERRSDRGLLAGIRNRISNVL